MSDFRPPFCVIGGAFIRDQLASLRPEVIQLVRDGYLQHDRGETVNPASQFLRLPHAPDARFIALPAAVNESPESPAVAGIKWIGSFPSNINSNLQRASAVIVLNDGRTGYPLACLEASGISAARTAASAALAARELTEVGKRAGTLGIVGAGTIAATILRYLLADGWRLREVVVHDAVAAHADQFVEALQLEVEPIRSGTADEALDADLVVLATTAPSPWIDPRRAFQPRQCMLNISLRDLAPEAILSSNNVLDDVGHCLTAQTSPHLAEQRVGHRGFISGTLAQVMTGQCWMDRTRPVVFSPFGLGLLDLKLATMLYERSQAVGAAVDIPDFFADIRRWAS